MAGEGEYEDDLERGWYICHTKRIVGEYSDIIKLVALINQIIARDLEGEYQ